RRHTSFSRDWSSDVCSSDLQLLVDRQPRDRGDPARNTHEPLGERWVDFQTSTGSTGVRAGRGDSEDGLPSADCGGVLLPVEVSSFTREPRDGRTAAPGLADLFRPYSEAVGVGNSL